MATTPPPTSVPAEAGARRRRGRPRGGQPLADREQLIAAAIRAAQIHGPKVSMEAIAAEAGVTKPIIYRTIGSKEKLAVAVSEQLSVEVEELTARILERHSDNKPVFAAAARAFFELLAEKRQLYLFVEYGWASSDGTQLARMIERSAEPFLEHFASLPNPPHLSPGAARTWAYSTVGAMRNVALMWVQDQYCSIDDLVDQVTTYYLNAFGEPQRERPRR